MGSFLLINNYLILSSNIEITLEEFAVPSLLHRRVISSVDFADVVPLDLLDAIGRHKPSKWHSQVIPKGEDLPALVLQIVDQLAPFLTVLTEQRLT
jgi:hypothetical protein